MFARSLIRLIVERLSEVLPQSPWGGFLSLSAWREIPEEPFFGNGTLMPMLPGQKEAAYRLKVYNKVLSEGFYNIEV